MRNFLFGKPSQAEQQTQRPATNEFAKYKLALDGISNAVIMIDRDFRVTYLNPASLKLFRDNIQKFQQVYPGFQPDSLIGSSIDRFHQNPEHQRRLLADPRNLPYLTKINVADLRFSLNITGLFNENGEYVGNTLEWENITDREAKDNRVASFESMIEGSSKALMMCDLEWKITYCNPSVLKLLGNHEDTLRKVFPGFNSNNLIGVCIDSFHKNPRTQHNILSDPSKLPYRAQIKVAHLEFDLNASALYDTNGKRIGNFVEWMDISDAREKANRIASFESMVEGSSTALMMCDQQWRITYCNPSVVNLLTEHQGRIRKVFPNFDASRLVGRCIDDFHKNPRHQQNILADERNLPYKAEIKVAGLEFGLNASALRDADGKWIGNFVEWTDLNERAAYRDEVRKVISASKDGKLTVRGETGHLSPVYADMMAGINDVIQAITAPINDFRINLEKVAQGDLRAYITADYKGDHAVIKDALNNTLDALNEILSQVAVTADQVNSGSAQVADSSQSLSSGATEQAAALEEITASMTEMASQTRANAENATQANELASNSRNSAETGNRRMKVMLDSMKAIEESSKNISKIINVIDEIAFQTNLLALNAAVEAARAGAHGKGFAVVAEEVRNLAARSANAAKETTGMIEESIKRVGEGSSIANETAKALEDIVEGISTVSDLVAEIAAASSEQAQGITQVNQALGQLDQVTQQNTANAEESAAASEELSSQSKQLRQYMRRFTLKEKEAGFNMNNLSPEILQAFQQLMRQNQGGGGSWGKVQEDIKHLYGKMPALMQGGNDYDDHDGDDIVDLSDRDFGKY